jgi:hypothetical protein
MMFIVRTTVTLESDVERLIREKMHRSRKSFKKTLNDAVRQGLKSPDKPKKSMKFLVTSRPMGMLPGIDPALVRDMDTDLEVEHFNTLTRQLIEKSK